MRIVDLRPGDAPLAREVAELLVEGVREHEPDVGGIGHAARIRNLRGHPGEFAQKLGFAVVGVRPGANGIGRPDLVMAKRVGR